MGFSSASLFSVRQVVTSLSFVIPEFQRGYAWNKEQWLALWNDLLAISRRPNSHHYAGAIMVAEQQGAEVVELIDGQQRITTIALLLAALGAEACEVQFRANEALQTYFDYYALGKQHLAPRLSQFRSYYSANLGNAHEFFASQAEGLSQEEKLKLCSALLDQFKLFVLVIQPEFDVHVAFETINNRGKPLSTLERLKNRLIFIAMNAEDQAAGREAAAEVHRSWKGVYTWLGAGKFLLDDDKFLRAHSIGWFRHARKTDWLTSQLFDEMFCTHGSTRPGDIVEYVRSLELAAACWHYLNEPERLPAQVARRLEALSQTASASSKPLLLWEKFSWDESVEHIYPQTPHALWSNEIAVDARSKRAKAAITNSLGNLLLLSSSVNAQLSNQPYVPVDGLTGKRQRFLGGSYSEMQVARLCDRWGVVQLAARGIAMLRLAQRTWKFVAVDGEDNFIDWLPFLFGDIADSVQAGAYTSGKKVDGRALKPWVKKFEDRSLVT